MEKTTDELTQILWDYNNRHDELRKADLILSLGSHDTRAAEYAAKLYLDGWAPLIVFSGDRGRLTGEWKQSEAEVFADVAEKAGVPRSAMLLESDSTNTGENIVMTRELLKAHSIEPKLVILSMKPYMARRGYATFKKRWPEMEIIVSSPPIALKDYPNDSISMEEIVHILVGDTQRIKVYPDRGFQIPQNIPEEVWHACEELVRRGYTRYLVV